MEGSGFSGRMYSNTGVGMLGLEIPLNQQQQQQSQQHLQKHPHMVVFTNNPHKQHQQHEQQTQLSMKQPTNYLSYNNPNSNPNPNTNPTQNQNQNQNPGHKIKTQMTHLTNSDEDEPGCANDHENSSVDGKKKGGTNVSPWHRMKWTDNMVRLLIMAVYYIGDEGGVEIGSDKKKSGSGGGGGGGGGGGLLQKKGKWKSVSRAMMEKGFYVSPQQCEDKFNDLNKRYKRVNDILGKGTACRVVENQTLLDSMDVTPKLKEEVRKLLNSKHLFFREMCAYHNSCGHGAGGHGSEPGAAATVAAVSVAEQPQHISQNHPQHHHHHQMPMPKQQHQQSCSHSATMSQSPMDPNNTHKLGLGSEDHDEDDDDDDEDDEDEYYEENEEQDEGGQRKRAKTVVGDSSNNNSHALQKLNGEVMSMLQDGSKSLREKKQWMMTQIVQLEEQGLKFQIQALELEKQRWKWIKFSSKKEREMEKMKIDNERKRLETERMMLLLKQKEMELVVEPSNPSCVSS